MLKIRFLSPLLLILVPLLSFALSPGKYSSIAYSPSTGGGAIVACATLGEAHPVALARCQAHRYPDCKIVLTTADSAVAIARGSKKSQIYGLGYGTSSSGANSMALRNCRKFDSSCKLIGGAPNCGNSGPISSTPAGCNGGYHPDPSNPNQCIPNSIPVIYPGSTCQATACVCASGGRTLVRGEICQ